MSLPSLKNWVRALGLVLLTVSVGSGVMALQYRNQARKAENAFAKERKAADARKPRLSHQEKAFIKTLWEQNGMVGKEEIELRDAIGLAAQLNIELNGRTESKPEPQKTLRSVALPENLSGRDFKPTGHARFPLSSGQIEIAGTPTLYQYAITNRSKSALPMPILHNGIRWDDAEKLVESLGLNRIEDETDRAIGIWRFVSEWSFHAQPVTEGDEEHDTIKFFSCYGYGFCDDASQAVAGLAKLCGLKARIWGLNGHVVPEIFAGGHWILLDADFAAYFYQPGQPRSILGVEELSKSREAFHSVVQLGKRGSFTSTYADFFLSTEDNRAWDLDARSVHQIAASLAPGEKVVFSNFNWGEYFLGAFPQRVSRFFNGYFEREMTLETVSIPPEIEVKPSGHGFSALNLSEQVQAIETTVNYPFPIVGGLLKSPVQMECELEDRATGKKTRFLPGKEVSFAGALAQVSKHPTTGLIVRILVPAKSQLSFESPPQLICDFQFAELALLRLRAGSSQFKVYSSAPDSLGGLEAEIWWRE